MISNATTHWYGVSRRDPRVVGLYARHYSSAKNGKTIRDWLDHGITAPGETITLMTSDCSALFVWLRQKYVQNDQRGVNCAVFHNEGGILSSVLILEAEEFAWARWKDERLFTYVNLDEVESRNPGYCFKKAGWQLVRDEACKPLKTMGGLLILEKHAIYPLPHPRKTSEEVQKTPLPHKFVWAE